MMEMEKIVHHPCDEDFPLWVITLHRQ